MLDEKEKGELRQGMKIIRLVWAAMLLSLGVYLYVCHATAAQRPPRKAAVDLSAMTTALLAAAAVELIVIRSVRRSLLKSGGPAPRQSPWRTARGAPSHPAAARYLAATVVSLALAGSIGIFGMVLFLLGADFRTLYLFVALSAAAMVHYRPKAEELASVAAAMKSDPAATKPGP